MYNEKFQRAQFEAYLGYSANFNFYLHSYHNAFNVLFEHVIESGRTVDHVAHPLLFLARHSIELGFKANIRFFQKYSQLLEHTNSTSHKLDQLFDSFKRHLSVAFNNLKMNGVEVSVEDILAFEELCREVDKLIKQFSLLDSKSMSFRYPVDIKDVPSFDYSFTLNIWDLKKGIDDAMLLLIHTSDVFSKYTDYVDKMKEEYEELMRDAYDY